MGPQGTPSAASSWPRWLRHKPPGEVEAGSGKKLGRSGAAGTGKHGLSLGATGIKIPTAPVVLALMNSEQMSLHRQGRNPHK